MFEPNSPLMHNYSGMGLGGGTGSGIDPFIVNKQVVFMGDSTFFHSGLAAISTRSRRQDILYIILANDTTAMTGTSPCRPDPRPARPAGDGPGHRADGPGGGRAGRPRRADRPRRRDNYKSLLEETILADGVKVIIADKECGITYNRRRMKRERAELTRRGFLAGKTT